MAAIIKTDNAPAAIGPYIQGIDLGNLIFISGQIPLDPISNSIPEDIKSQTQQVLTNITSILAAAGLNANNIIKTTVFLTDLSDFNCVNNIYEKYFNSAHASFPARSCVQVAALPQGVKIEIEAIATR